MTATSSRRILVSSVLLLGSLGVLQAQQPSPTNAFPAGSTTAMVAASPDQPLQIFRTRTDEVNVIFTVTDKHNHFIKDLRETQFKILDNNLPPRQIMNFEAETNMPLRVGLLIDASDSITDRFTFEQRAASEFLRQVIRPQTDKAFVLAFDDHNNVTQEFTSDLEKLTRGLHQIRPGGGTAIWDAIYYACRDKLMQEHPDSPDQTFRKAIIVVSDGADNQSRVSRAQAVDMAQRAGVIVYTVSTNMNNILDSGDHNLKALADSTGGRAFFPAKLHDLTDAFRDIREELRSQYSVSYKPEQFDVAGGQYRPIQIMAENKKYHVRSKRGYYVPRQ
ncbi:MAG TPA: VWA domain-containing protein [Terriglobales bacterium]|nr:VWA domain-containing protein [Terriglobales bacterium]